MIDGDAAVNHQVIGNSVFERNVMPLELHVAVPAMAVVEPLLWFDGPLFDRLKNECLVNVILAMGQSGVAKRADQCGEDRTEFWRPADNARTIGSRAGSLPHLSLADTAHGGGNYTHAT